MTEAAILRSGQLIVAPEKDVGRCLEQADISLLVSVGCDYSGRPNVPVIRICCQDQFRLTRAEWNLAVASIHSEWKRNGNVLCHCFKGEDRSVTFAKACVADYYGHGREAEALEYVRQSSLRGDRYPYEATLESVIPFLSEDEVAVYFLTEIMARTMAMDERQIYYALVGRKFEKQGEDPQILHDARNRGNLFLDTPGLSDENLTPQALSVRQGERNFARKWLYSEETLQQLAAARDFPVRASGTRREICLDVLNS